MNRVGYRDAHEPFAFWLARTYLPPQEAPDEAGGPVSKQELLAVSVLILAAFCLYALFVGPFSL